MYINVLLPVYNEELRLEKGVTGTANYFSSIHFMDYKITIIDNASTDKTQMLAEVLAEQYKTVNYIRIDEKGVGAAFRKGVQENDCEIVGYMDIDLSTDVSHLTDVIQLFTADSELAIVNGSRLSKASKTTGRKWYRNITSRGLTWILKVVLKMKANDSICGFKFFRKECADALVKISGSENGWFYIIELLLRAERQGYKIKELPVRWKDDYNSTVHVFKLVKNYLINIVRLRKRFKKEKIL